MIESGFYKKLGNDLLFAENSVMSPIIVLLREEHLNYEYPQDGWYWFETEQIARDFFRYNPSAISPTEEMYVERVQEHMDRVAKTRNYDGILSLCTYVSDSDPIFAAEGQAGVNWRSAVWRTCYNVLEQVKQGQRLAPTINELLNELPTIDW